MVVLIDNLAPCGAYVFWGRDPAVALRFTAGYAHLAPRAKTASGIIAVKREIRLRPPLYFTR
ncbi:MAG: hypothetical protein LBU34_10600 [Planctomycetaceae bacterium]|jgi:hypothetical protein|nr:hypothetical protein [Planctomycetaceae bacterium]